jgi:hypothetical protein
MPKKLDLINKRFGRLLVVEEVDGVREPSGAMVRRFLCKCDCGNEKIFRVDSLRKRAKSCGCLNAENIRKPKKHGLHKHPLYMRWDTIKQSCNNPNNANYSSRGAKGIKMFKDWEDDFLSFYNWCMENGFTNDMQLTRIDKSGDFEPNNCKFKPKLKRHGLTNHILYKKWDSMKQRCYNKKNDFYHRYGGRGIKMCDEWLNNFKSFYDWSMENGWRKDLTIDRIDSNKNYEPSNCRYIPSRLNTLNTNKRMDNKSGYKGVSWSTRDKKWISRIAIKGKVISLGNYTELYDAVEARNKYIRKHQLQDSYPIQQYKSN